MKTRAPLVSFALPVRNGIGTLAQAIESVRHQTLEDWELVISDNCSTDGTTEMCASFAADDPRILHIPTGHLLSQNDNFCKAYHQTRGTYVRWCGDDDWLDPLYAERTTQALEADSRMVLCTTLQQFYMEDEQLAVNDALNKIEGVVAKEPAARVAQLLFILQNTGRFGIDPMYSLMRREALARTSLVLPLRFGDFILSSEMAMLGPFRHLPHILAHRRLPKSSSSISPLQQFTNRQDWTRFIQREISIIKVMQAAARYGVNQQYRLVGSLLAFALREHSHGLFRRIRALRT